jgi:hypothetical protein
VNTWRWTVELVSIPHSCSDEVTMQYSMDRRLAARCGPLGAVWVIAAACLMAPLVSYGTVAAAGCRRRATSEGEHLKDMLVGNILAVSQQEVLTTAGLYLLIGIFHYVFRRRFLLITMDPQRAEAEGVSIRL